MNIENKLNILLLDSELRASKATEEISDFEVLYSGFDCPYINEKRAVIITETAYCLGIQDALTIIKKEESR